MGSVSLGDARRIHSQSHANISGRESPEEVLIFNLAAAAGATDLVLFVNPGGVFKVIDVRERHTTPGTNPITLRVHKAGQVAAPSAAVSGTNIFNLASIVTTTAANTWAKPGSGVTFSSSPGTAANGRAISAQVLYAGDTLVANIPATVVGICLQIMGIYV